MQQHALRTAWIDFLSPIQFQWFATLTFESNIHPEEALKRWQRFTNGINRTIYGRRWTRRIDGGIYWIVAIERQKRGVVHLHALIGSNHDLGQISNKRNLANLWRETSGFARIETIRNGAAVLRYVTKHVIGNGDIEFSKNLGACEPQQQLFRVIK